MDVESRKELADLKRREPLDTRFKGPASIGPFRRWLRRRLIEAEERGDQKAVEQVMLEMKEAGMNNG